MRLGEALIEDVDDRRILPRRALRLREGLRQQHRRGGVHLMIVGELLRGHAGEVALAEQ